VKRVATVRAAEEAWMAADAFAAWLTMLIQLQSQGRRDDAADVGI
jgi:hypothetical protein